MGSHGHKCVMTEELLSPIAETFPSEALSEEVERRGGVAKCNATQAAAASQMKYQSWERQFYRKTSPGSRLTLEEVDHYCIHLLGVHPGFLYPQWWLVPTA